MASITATSGIGAGRRYPIPTDGAPLRIGRSRDNDVVLPGGVVSRYHCHIEDKDGRCILTDRGSQNGTRVNGERIKDCVLKDDDRVRIGKTIFRFDALAADDQDTVLEPTPVPVDENVGASTVVSSDRPDDAPRTPKPTTKEEKRRELQILSEATKQFASCRTRSQLVEQAIDVALQLSDGDRGAILLHDEQARRLRVGARRPRGTVLDRLPLSKTILRQAMKGGTLMSVADAMADERFGDETSVNHFQIRSAAYVPLKTSARIVGLLAVDTTNVAKRFSDRHLHMLSVLADHLSLALEELASTAQRAEVEEHAPTHKRHDQEIAIPMDALDLAMPQNVDLKAAPDNADLKLEFEPAAAPAAPPQYERARPGRPSAPAAPTRPSASSPFMARPRMPLEIREIDSRDTKLIEQARKQERSDRLWHSTRYVLVLLALLFSILITLLWALQNRSTTDNTPPAKEQPAD